MRNVLTVLQQIIRLQNQKNINNEKTTTKNTKNTRLSRIKKKYRKNGFIWKVNIQT